MVSVTGSGEDSWEPGVIASCCDGADADVVVEEWVGW